MSEDASRRRLLNPVLLPRVILLTLVPNAALCAGSCAEPGSGRGTGSSGPCRARLNGPTRRSQFYEEPRGNPHHAHWRRPACEYKEETVCLHHEASYEDDRRHASQRRAGPLLFAHIQEFPRPIVLAWISTARF
jgi:hypothetical protein